MIIDATEHVVEGTRRVDAAPAARHIGVTFGRDFLTDLEA
jgi:hypothetical protein